MSKNTEKEIIMGIFDFFKKKEKTTSLCKASDITSTAIPESEKRFYQPDGYYTNKTHEGTAFEQTVITFDERKKTCISSKTGLYYVTSANVVNNFFGIRNSVEQVSHAAYILDIVKSLPEDFALEGDYFNFILNSLFERE